MINAVEDKIVVKLLKRTKSVGGIILPETAVEPQAFGKVISIGNKVEGKIAVGQIIVSHIRGGMDAVIGNKFIKILKLEEVYGILTDKETLDVLEDIELQSPKTDPSRIIKPV